MTERLGKRVSRSITFYPTPEDQELLEELDRQADAQMLTFSELCKIALRQFIQGEITPAPPSALHPYTLDDTELQQQIEVELRAQGMNFSDWVKQKLSVPAPAELESRIYRLEQVVIELQQRPVPLTRPEIEHLIQQHLTPTVPEKAEPAKAFPPPPPPPKPTPATDPLIAELGALLLEDF